jgi:SpoIID/LytB domain protein
MAVPAGQRLLIRATANGLVVNNDQVFAATELVLAPERREPQRPELDEQSQLQQIELQEAAHAQPVVRLGERHLRGSLVIHRLDAEHMAVVNALPVEAWVAGVLAAEATPAWSPEALAALAITARSYAVSRLRGGPRLAMTGEPAVPFQVRDQRRHVLGTDPRYVGQGPVWPAAAFAVAKTRGTILVAQGVGFAALMHTASGGRRADVQDLLPGATAADGRQPLAAIMLPSEDEWSEAGSRLLGHPEWHRREQSWHELALLNNELKRRYGEIAADWAVSRSPVGRLRGGSFVSLQTQETITVSAWDFLSIMDVAGFEIPSAWWDRESPQRVPANAQQPYTSYSVTSFGTGHGMGLSLASAAAQGHAGWRHDEILAYAFSGCRLLRQW